MMSPPAVPCAHLLLTRFSVRPSEQEPPPTAAWLRFRLELFAAYCLPSVRAQSRQHLRWLLFCDERTDADGLAELSRLSDGGRNFEVVLTTPRRAALGGVLARLPPGLELLITTRLDSDDALARDFVARVQAYVAPFLAGGRPSFLLNFPYGYRFRESTRSVHATWNPHSPQLTMFERLDGGRHPTTVQAGNHGYMQEEHPLHLDGGPAGWLQVIHGGNVSNTIGSADRPIGGASVLDRFAISPRSPLAPAVEADQPADGAGKARYRQGLEDALLGEAAGPGAAGR